MARKLTMRQSLFHRAHFQTKIISKPLANCRLPNLIFYAASFDEIVGRQMVSQNPERAVRTRNRSPLNSRNEKPALAHGRSQP